MMCARALVRLGAACVRACERAPVCVCLRVFVEMDRRLYALQPLWSVWIRRWLNCGLR